MYFLYGVFWLLLISYLFEWMGAWGDVLLWTTLAYALCTLLPWYLARHPRFSPTWAAHIHRFLSMPVILTLYGGAVMSAAGGWMLSQGHNIIGLPVFLVGGTLLVSVWSE